MVRIFKLLLALIVLGLIGAIGLLGYAYFGDMTPERGEVSQPVTLDVD